MKNILVPTDFSENANNALRYAINLAIQFGSKIHLINSYEVPSQTGMLVSIRDFMKKDAEDGLAKTKADFQDHLVKGITLETKSIEGYTDQVIYGYAGKIKADLIVMGTQGASALKGVFMGSNTAKVIQHSSVPVLAIPNDYNYEVIKDIALAVDHKVISDDSILKPLVEIAKVYKAHVSVLHVEKELVASSIDDGIDVYLKGVPHSFNTVYNDNVKEGIDRFVDKIDADLLCMIHRDRGFLGNLFHRSAVKKSAFDSTAPLLVMYEK